MLTLNWGLTALVSILTLVNAVMVIRTRHGMNLLERRRNRLEEALAEMTRLRAIAINNAAGFDMEPKAYGVPPHGGKW